MFSSDVPESPERVRRVRWSPWDVYMRSSRGKRPREQQWCRGNQEQLARKSEDLQRVAKPLWPPVRNNCRKPVSASVLWSSITKPSVRFLHGIPYNHLTNIPDYNRPLFTWMTCMSEKEWGVEDLIKRHLPLPDLLCRDRYREVTGPPSSFYLSLSILFPWTLWDAWVTSLCSVVWVRVLCDACVLCNCSTKHPWWQSDRHAFSHSTPAIFIEMQHLAQVSGSV